MDCIAYVPQRYKMIYDFCIKLYYNLIKEMTVLEACLDA